MLTAIARFFIAVNIFSNRGQSHILIAIETSFNLNQEVTLTAKFWLRWKLLQSRLASKPIVVETSFNRDQNFLSTAIGTGFSHFVSLPVIGLILTTVELAFDCVQNHFDCDWNLTAVETFVTEVKSVFTAVECVLIAIKIFWLKWKCNRG